MKTASLLLFAALATSAFAWNKPGHMLTGSIAYLELKATVPQSVAKAVELLKQHPDYRRWEKAAQDQRMTADQIEEYLFMMAARWPDDARGTPEHRGNWHYVNLPYTPDGTAGANVPADPKGELLKQLPANLAVVKDGGRPKAERAKALSWIFHLVGDLHQPLHAVALYSGKREGWRDGDSGGNQFFVVTEPGRSPKDLHSLWDGIVIGSERAQVVRTSARKLHADRPSSGFASELAVGWDPAKWAEESRKAATESVYSYDGTRIPGGDDKHDTVKPLPSDYAEAGGDLGEQRACLAAYRLAAAIKDALR